MCTIGHTNNNPRRPSSNLKQLDRLIRAFTRATPSTEEIAQDDPEVYVNFGVFDSLTLAKGRNVRTTKSEDDDSANQDIEDPIIEQDIDSAQKVTTPIMSLPRHNDKDRISIRRRTGVRRGFIKNKNKMEIILVPTKLYDGPSASV